MAFSTWDEYAYARDGAVTPTGKAIVLGDVAGPSPSGTTNFGLTRFKRDGSPDLDFGDRGWVSTYITPDVRGFRATALVVLAGGTILAVGDASSNGRSSQWFLARYRPDGSLDSRFGEGGVVTLEPPFPVSAAEAAAVDGYGRIVVAGWMATERFGARSFLLARLDPAGALDSRFGEDGFTVTTFAPEGRAASEWAEDVLIRDGRIVAVGTTAPLDAGSSSRFAVARYRLDGTLDDSFGGDGLVTTTFGSRYDTADSATAVAHQLDGRILVAGSTGVDSYSETRFALVRYRPDGSVDATFGRRGRVQTAFGRNARRSFVADVALSPGGKIVAFGGSEPVSARGYGSTSYLDWALARYRTSGVLDETFSEDGRVLRNFDPLDKASGTADQSRAVTVLGDGDIVALGGSYYPWWGANQSFTVARFEG